MKCINQLSATLSSASDHKTLINFAECKPVIFDELTFPNYTTHYNYAEKYNLISEIIETAKDEQVASDDLSDLYLYRAIYAENMNLTQYMEDLRTAHNLNKHSLPAASLLSLVYREWGHESYKPEFVEDAYWNTERFPWKGNKSFEIVDTSPFSDMTNENFIAYIKSEYESLKDNTDYYSVYLKLEKAKLLIQYFENPTLFEAFKKRHGQCIELNNSMLSASCYEVEMNEALINSDADALVNAYNAGKQKFQQLKGLRGEIRLFIEFQLLQREFTAEEVKRKKIQEIGEEYEYFISSAYENGDTATAIDLKYRYANKIMGLEYQNNVKALSLIKQAIEESERYLSDFQLRNLRLRTGWREYQYGDKDEGINLIGRHLDLIELVQDVPSLLNFLNLAQIYFDENGEDEQAKLSASEKLIDLYFQQNLTLDEELDLVDTLVVVKKFNLALHVLTKIHEKRENSQEVKKYMIKVFVARLLDISSLFSMFSVVPDEVTLESMRSQIKTVEEFAQDLDIPSFNRSEFEENIRTIKSGFGIAPTEPKLSEKEKYIEFLHTNSNLPTDIYTPNEHVHKIVDYWEMELAENTFSAPDFDEAEKRASHFLIELLAPHALEYLSRDGRERQYFYDAISFSEEEIELVKAATEQLKFITEKSKGFPSSEVRMITLVQAAVASYNVRNVDTFNFFVSEAFQKLEHPNYATKFPFENNHNSQLIFLRGRQLMQRCGGYRDAIAVLDEHINLFERFNIPIDPEREYYFNNRKVCIH